VVARATVREVVNGEVVADSGHVLARAQRIVSLPRLEGPAVEGLAADAHGFLPVDEEGRVTGTDSVFAAGDGTTSPIKQGGLAAQQADAVARAIARRAGADVEARPFRPVLRAKLLTGSQAKYLRRAVGGEEAEDSEASDHTLWWPPTKVAAPYLSPYLDELDESGISGSRPSTGGPAASEKPPAGHAEGDPSGGIELLGR
jgi:sulfide:quinone oxidoreductase